MEVAHRIDDSSPEAQQGLDDLLKGRDVKWYKGRYRRLNLILFLLVISSMNNGYDGSMMNGLQTIDNWRDYFNHPHGSVLGVFNAIQSIGAIVGLPLAPYLNDRFGRRWALTIGNIITLIGVVLQTAAQNVGMFIGCRFLIGFGLSFATMAAPVLITELAFPTHRAPMTGLFNSSWYLGSIVAAWVTYGTFRIESTWSWRIPSLLQGVPAVLQLALVFVVVPESPRWLVANGRDEQALRIITEYHCAGDESDPLAQFEYQEIKEALRIEREINRTSSYKDLFSTPGNRRRMLAIMPYSFFSQWSGNGIISYYLNLALAGVGITSTGQKNLINGILQLWNVITAYGGALIVDRAGRRPLWLTSAAGMCVAYAAITAASAVYAKSPADDPNTSAGYAVVALFFVYYLFYNIAMSPLLSAYTIEILPFHLRTKGLFVSGECVNASLVFNQYVNPIALPKLGYKYYAIYTAWLGVEFIWLYFTIIETKGPHGALPLEEIAALFDGEDKRQEIAQHQMELGPVPSDKKLDEEHVEDIVMPRF